MNRLLKPYFTASPRLHSAVNVFNGRRHPLRGVVIAYPDDKTITVKLLRDGSEITVPWAQCSKAIDPRKQ